MQGAISALKFAKHIEYAELRNIMKKVRRKKRNITAMRKLSRTWQLSVMVLPALILVLIFNYLPMFGVVMSFQDYNPGKGFFHSSFVGLKHFLRFFRSYNAALTIENTVKLSLFSLLWSFPLPIILALLLNQVTSPIFKRTVQTVTYLPYFISTVVLVSVVNLFLSPTRGIYGLITGWLGIADPINPITDPGAFRTVYIGSSIWQSMGFSSIIYLAALSGVDPALHEAAIIDGASKFKRMLHIDLPALKPTIIIMFIMACGNLMTVGFEKAYLMQNSVNLSVSEVLQTYVYKVGIVNAQYSFSAAINLFNTVINIILLLLVNWIVGKVSETSLL